VNLLGKFLRGIEVEIESGSKAPQKGHSKMGGGRRPKNSLDYSPMSLNKLRMHSLVR
jgi:hypothetical protein